MLGFLSKRREPGWTTVHVLPQRVDVARVAAGWEGGRLRILALDSFERRGSLADTLEALRKGLGLQKRHCTTLLEAGEYQWQQVEAPDVPAEETKDATRWKLKDLLAYPVETATVDVLEIPADGTTGRPKSLFAVSAENAVIAGRMADFATAGVPLDAIDVPEAAQRNVAARFEDENRGLALLVINEGGGLLTFTHKGNLYATRRIEIGSGQLAEASQERREQMFERIGLELQRSIDNFDRQYGFIPLTRLLVASAAVLEGLIDYLAPNLSIPVAALDLAAVADFPEVPELAQAARQAQCLHAIGAALRPAA